MEAGYTINAEGEKVLAGSRRPDGTLRKERRIRSGYTPQDEQPVYQSGGVLVRATHSARTQPAVHVCVHLEGLFVAHLLSWSPLMLHVGTSEHSQVPRIGPGRSSN